MEDVPPTAPTGLYARVVKPVLDRVLGLVLAIVTLPLLLVLLVVCWVEFGWAPLQRVARVGRNRHRFNLYRLNTRRDYHTDLRGRPLRVSRFLRSTSLDELPQVWNVAFGHLSLVGPRPLDPVTVRDLDERARARHFVRPGLTGPWQLEARGDGRRLPEHVDVDLRYLQRISFWYDAGILLRTIPALMRSREEV